MTNPIGTQNKAMPPIEIASFAMIELEETDDD